MLTGSKKLTEGTTLTDVANMLAVYEVLSNNWGYEFNLGTRILFGNIRSSLDSVARNRGLWNAEDLVDNSAHCDDHVTWLWATSTRLDNGKECNIDQAVWTFKCIVGWVLHDCFVDYVFKGTEKNASIACMVARWKLDWHEAQKDQTIRELRVIQQKYNNLIKEKNEEFYLESGEVLT
jgi:hypothetical protein